MFSLLCIYISQQKARKGTIFFGNLQINRHFFVKNVVYMSVVKISVRASKTISYVHPLSISVEKARIHFFLYVIVFPSEA